MTLKERITDDMKQAMRAKDADRLSTIRMLLAAIKQKEVDERIEVDDAQTIAIVDKLIKQRRDSIDAYQKAGRDDLASREAAEVTVLSAYLPQRASEAEVNAEIDAALEATGAAGPQDMGRVMGVLKSRLAGRADMGLVSAQVKARLTHPA